MKLFPNIFEPQIINIPHTSLQVLNRRFNIQPLCFNLKLLYILPCFDQSCFNQSFLHTIHLMVAIYNPANSNHGPLQQIFP